MAGRDTVRVPGDDGVRHDIQELRREMHARFDDMAEREDAAHAAIGERIGSVEERIGSVEKRMAQVEAKLDLLIERLT